MPDLVGWLATAIFAVSYFCKRTTTLRRVQGIAALAWATYGVLSTPSRSSWPTSSWPPWPSDRRCGDGRSTRPDRLGPLQAQEQPRVEEPAVHPELRNPSTVDKAAEADVARVDLLVRIHVEDV